MKVVVLNVAQQCVEVYPIDEHVYELYGGKDFDGTRFLSEQGLPMNDISWMLVDDQDDIVPVFWNGAEEPYVTL